MTAYIDYSWVSGVVLGFEKRKKSKTLFLDTEP